MHFGFSQVLRLSVAVIALAVLAGCGGGSTANSNSQGPTPNDGLIDLQAMLKGLKETNQPIPKSVQELGPLDPLHPTAAAFLQNGSIAYYWGTPLDAAAPNAATTVIAHEKEAESKGGWVLMQDGNIKQMTADEFKAATKPASAAKK